MNLLDILEAEYPVNRLIKIDGRIDAYVWRLETDQIQQIVNLPRDNPIELAVETVVIGIGDASGPGSFNSERGRTWLRTHPTALLSLASTVQEFNELTGPSDARKKKSETMTESEDSSTSACDSELDTLDD